MPVACSPEIVRLYTGLFPRPTWEDSKLAGLEVADYIISLHKQNSCAIINLGQGMTSFWSHTL